MRVRVGLMWLIVLWPSVALAGKVTLVWDANSEADLAGYKVYYGRTRALDKPIEIIDVKKQTTCTITGLENGVYYFAVTAYDAHNFTAYLFSILQCSNQIRADIFF